MNRFLFSGLAMAMLSNGMAFAADAYQPAEYQPKVDYSAPAASAKPEADAVAIVSQPEKVDVKKEAKALQPEASPVNPSTETARKTVEDSPRAAGSTAISSPSEQTSGSSSNIVFIVAGLAAIGIFFFRRRATAVSIAMPGYRSVESAEGPTGVERYIEKLARAKKTGVEKYLENLPEAPPITGVAKYLARQRK